MEARVILEGVHRAEAHIRRAETLWIRNAAAPLLVSRTVSMLVAQAGHDHPPARPFALFVEWQALVVVYFSQMGELRGLDSFAS